MQKSYSQHLLDLFLSIFVVVFTTLTGGITAYFLWEWFAAPIFHVSLSYWQAIGLTFVVSYFAHQTNYSDAEYFESKTNAERYTSMLAASICKDVSFLGFGWIIHLFL